MASEEIATQVDHSQLDTQEMKVPVFFPVSLLKLAVLSICTFGLYEIYWFYKNWNCVKRREESDIIPAARSIFAYFFCYAFFRRVSDSAAETIGNRLPAGALAAGWIVTTALWRLPDPYWLVCFSAVLFMLPIQSAINSINAKESPDHDRNGHFSAWNIVGVVLGGLLFILGEIGKFLPAEQV